MPLLRQISLDGHAKDVQNFIAGENVTFATQSDGSIQINASGGGGGCVTYSLAWDSASKSFRLTNSEGAVVQSEVLTGLATEAYVNAGPAYVESNKDSGGNVVQIGTVERSGTTYGLYQFFFKTGALPGANAMIEYSMATLLADYTISDFIDATGVTSNGVFIGNGRTDNDNRVIVQQFSKNRKAISLRAYQDFSAQTAFLKIQFIGTKN